MKGVIILIILVLILLGIVFIPHVNNNGGNKGLSLGDPVTEVEKVEENKTEDTPEFFFIDIKNFELSENDTVVRVDDVVRWTNRDNEIHTINSDSGYLESGLLSKGENYIKVFNKKGVYNYYCRLYPEIRGRIIVV